MRPGKNRRIGSAAVALVLGLAFGNVAAWCQPPGSLKNVGIPQPSGLAKYVRDPAALIVLGKALFWDMQLSSDGRVACATCHFHAGADHRIQNQLSNPSGPLTPNYKLLPDDFPFHQLSNTGASRSPVVRDSGQRAGSAGMFRRLFVDIVPGAAAEDGYDVSDTPAFSLSGINVRQVGLRNAPTVINAVFFYRNFWDGRASNIFTGQTPFGQSDPRANALVLNGADLVPENVRIDNSSLASQAVGPPVNAVEMSYDGRNWPKVGKKMLALRALALQAVAADDSVLGPLADPGGRGLAPGFTYLALVRSAFQPAYWSASQKVDRAGNVSAAGTADTAQFAQAEFNFALFFGLAVQAYESTLVSDDSRFDQFSEGKSDALSAGEQAGLQIYRARGQCTRCHGGAELTDASFANVARNGPVQRQRNGLGPDQGFFRTGVRPAGDDSGLGGTDDSGNPYSAAAALNPAAASAVDGAFKTPALRNVEFTGPYFHNGGQATLEEVVDFYARGGDFPAAAIRPLNLSADDRAALVAFLKALSDDRVRFERAPFDHPEICVSTGAAEALPGTPLPQAADPRFQLSAADQWAGIPAVGRQGNAVPLQTFDELLRGIGTDGSRAHSLGDRCTIP